MPDVWHMNRAWADRGLDLVRHEMGRFQQLLGDLPTPLWSAPTNCAGWMVRDAVVHVTRVTDGYRDAVERGLQGNLIRRTDEERQARFAGLASASPEVLCGRLREYGDEYQQLFARLSEDELQTPAMHPFGPRPAAWFVGQEVAELALHSWDVRQSLRLEAGLAEDVADWLLPFIVEWNLARLDSGSAALTVRINNWTKQLPENVSSEAQPQLTINGDARSLCLFLYGRNPQLAGLQASGVVQLLERFKGI